MMEEEGLASVTLRRLAARLQVRPPTIAWHVGDKDRLLALMSELIFQRCLVSVPACATWQQWLREYGLALWKAQYEIRDLPRLRALAPRVQEVGAMMTRQVEMRMAEVGLSSERGIPMQFAVQALVVGWTALRDHPYGEQPMTSQDAFECVLDTLIAGWTSQAGQDC